MAYPFHLAFPVRDLAETRAFYGEVLGCRTGRSGEDWLDIDFFGSQIVAHVLADGAEALPRAGVNRIDGQEVPLPHFGCVLPMEEWREMAERLRREGIEFLSAPHVRYRNALNEQASMIFQDPSGNVLELKSFGDPSKLFAAE